MWPRSPASPDLSAQAPLVTDHRRTPRGVLPRHLQTWVMLGTALVMMGILAITGRSTPPRTRATTPGGAAAIDPNLQRIEEYQTRIQEQAQRLAAEQAQLHLAKQALVGAPGRPATPTESVGTAERSTSATDPLQHERAQREYRSLFADNLAVSRASLADSSFAVAPIIPSSSAEAASANAVSAPGAPGTPGVGDSGVPAHTETAARLEHPSPAPAASNPPTYRLSEGTIIETVLTNRLDGTYAGPVNCLVTTPVYAEDRQHLLIPAGARVLGDARAVNTFGQSRLAVVFHRVILPNLASVALDRFPGLNQIGEIGLRDQVNRHYWQIFGASLAIGAIAGFAQGRTSVGLDATAVDAYRQSVAGSLAQSSARILDRFLNLLPTVTIREGHRIKVYLSADLELPAYRDDGASDASNPQPSRDEP